MQQEQQKRISFGAWKKQTKEGKEVINFTINGQRYNMWANSYKDKPEQPDYKIYEDNYVKPEQSNAVYAPQPQQQYAQPQVQQQYAQPQYVQPQVQQPQVQQPQQGFVPVGNGLNF